MYSLLIDTYIKDPAQCKYLFNAMGTLSCVKCKARLARLSGVSQPSWMTTSVTPFLTYSLFFVVASTRIWSSNSPMRSERHLKFITSTVSRLWQSIHSLLIDTYIKDPPHCEHLFDAMGIIPYVKHKARPAGLSGVSLTNIQHSLSIQLCRCWRHGSMPGLTFSNKLISRECFTCHSDQNECQADVSWIWFHYKARPASRSDECRVHCLKVNVNHNNQKSETVTSKVLWVVSWPACFSPWTNLTVNGSLDKDLNLSSLLAFIGLWFVYLPTIVLLICIALHLYSYHLVQSLHSTDIDHLRQPWYHSL